MSVHPEAIVSAEWIREHLDDPEVSFVHVGTDRAEYEQAHLSGAVFADGYADFTVERGGVRALVPSAEELAATLGRLGIADGRRLVFYAARKSMWPSRAFWVMRYYRWPRLHIAERGLEAMARAGVPTSTEEPRVVPAVARPGPPDASVIAMVEDVLAVAEGEDATSRVLDCRTDEEWRGESTGTHEAPRRGRVPRATHLNWELLVDAEGAFHSPERLRSLFAAAGIDGRQSVFPYCGGGIRSAASWFAMHEILGWELARNYDGSWAEWSRRDELPITTG